MKVILLIAAVAAQGSARHQSQTNNPHEWIAPGPNDFRGPCPMLNTLSNHGFFPRDGRNITKANAVAGLKNGINFNGTLGEIMWDQAIIVNPEPNATFFTLEQLSLHSILEHDASLTRTDAFFGNNRVFNETVYKQSRQWWTDEVVTVKQLAHSKIFRQIESRAQNPNYTFSATTEEFSIGEVAAPIIVFGDMASGTVQRDLMEYFFVNERLPEELGWTKKSNEITLMNILSTTAMVRNATSLITGPSAEAPESPHTARDLHAGLVTAL